MYASEAEHTPISIRHKPKPVSIRPRPKPISIRHKPTRTLACPSPNRAGNNQKKGGTHEIEHQPLQNKVFLYQRGGIPALSIFDSFVIFHYTYHLCIIFLYFIIHITYAYI